MDSGVEKRRLWEKIKAEHKPLALALQLVNSKNDEWVRVSGYGPVTDDWIRRAIQLWDPEFAKTLYGPLHDIVRSFRGAQCQVNKDNLISALLTTTCSESKVFADQSQHR